MFYNLGSAEPQSSTKGGLGFPRQEVNKRRNRKTKIAVSSITPQKMSYKEKNY